MICAATHAVVDGLRLVAPEPLGVPVPVWALGVSLFSLLIALTALGWQIAKHFLDGGRVRVYLNAAIWKPEFMLATNRSGKLRIRDDDSARSVQRGEALELAQLVVENPGRTAVTIYSPGLSISGHGKKHHSLVPRMFSTGTGFGPDNAVTDTVVRLDPYARVTFLLDYWSVVPGILNDAPRDRVFLRGFVGVAGRTKRPQKSSRRLRWKIERGMYTAVEGSPPLTPLAVLWREMYVRLPERADDEHGRHPDAGPPVTRGMARYVLDEAMSRFRERPERGELQAVVDEIAQRQGDRFPMLGFSLLEGYEALDRLEGHLTVWTEGLFHISRPGQRVAESATGDPLDDRSSTITKAHRATEDVRSADPPAQVEPVDEER